MAAYDHQTEPSADAIDSHRSTETSSSSKSSRARQKAGRANCSNSSSACKDPADSNTASSNSSGLHSTGKLPASIVSSSLDALLRWGTGKKLLGQWCQRLSEMDRCQPARGLLVATLALQSKGSSSSSATSERSSSSNGKGPEAVAVGCLQDAVITMQDWAAAAAAAGGDREEGSLGTSTKASHGSSSKGGRGRSKGCESPSSCLHGAEQKAEKVQLVLTCLGLLQKACQERLQVEEKSTGEAPQVCTDE